MTAMTTEVRPGLLSGNRLLAEGALEAGCRFFSGYPITPASEIYETMMKELPARKGLSLAAPDEMTALAHCVGASMSGYKAMAATSGPGWCLMIETVQYAVTTETPVVIALVQRLGPSTGGATQGAQGDVLLAEFCISGGYTLPVFAPATARQCYETAQAAFHWSERLRTPVVILSDKEVGMTLESVDASSLPKWPRVDRTPFDGAGERFVTYACPCPEEAPPFAPLGGGARVIATGSAHDRAGRLRKNSDEVIDVLTHLQTKIAAHADEMALSVTESAANADVLVVSYGISARAARAACRRLREAGRRASFLQLLTLFPVPARVIRRAAEGCSRILVVEENLTGLYASVLEPLLGADRVVRVNRIGRMITPTDVVEAAESA
jgi:2-oxoglutarate/2-oxoacid ferredoxin oxidoreductase subunit alpha